MYFKIFFITMMILSSFQSTKSNINMNQSVQSGRSISVDQSVTAGRSINVTQRVHARGSGISHKIDAVKAGLSTAWNSTGRAWSQRETEHDWRQAFGLSTRSATCSNTKFVHVSIRFAMLSNRMDAALYESMMEIFRVLSDLDHKVMVEQSMRIKKSSNNNDDRSPFYYNDKFQTIFLIALSLLNVIFLISCCFCMFQNFYMNANHRDANRRDVNNWNANCSGIKNATYDRRSELLEPNQVTASVASYDYINLRSR